MTAVADLGVALRELVATSVRTTVDTDELSAAAAQVREVTARLAVAQRPAHRSASPTRGRRGSCTAGMSGLLMVQLLRSAAIASGLWGMTAHLELDYHRPVPLDTPLVLRAHVVEDSGRRTAVEGTIALAAEPDRAMVEARGVFVAPRPEKVAGYFGAVTDASGRHAPPGRPTDATEVRGR